MRLQAASRSNRFGLLLPLVVRSGAGLRTAAAFAGALRVVVGVFFNAMTCSLPVNVPLQATYIGKPRIGK